jgi:hypothetical protein
MTWYGAPPNFASTFPSDQCGHEVTGRRTRKSSLTSRVETRKLTNIGYDGSFNSETTLLANAATQVSDVKR